MMRWAEIISLRLTLMVNACRIRQLRRYAVAFPASFAVTLRQAQERRVELLARLEAL